MLIFSSIGCVSLNRTIQELKSCRRWLVSAYFLGLNRTIQELKLRGLLGIAVPAEGLNRTIQELKSDMSDVDAEYYAVLIVPYRN